MQIVLCGRIIVDVTGGFNTVMICQRKFFSFGIAALGLVLSALTACAVSGPGPDHEFHNYQTAVAQAPKEGWTAYWLGRSVEQGGVTFTGPSVADFGDEVDGGGVIMTYNARVPGAGYDFDVSLFSRGAWSAAVTRGFAKRLVGTAQRTIKIGGADATVTSGPVRNEGVRIDVDLGNTHILARVGPTFARNGEDLNPLIDEATFLAVLQHLRPYPQ